ncbi:Hypothetical predicted protein [Marmota monax]|uniref:Uncharacterized protein n=1 Tax=Marmota monax TaxID=9995 RepID=A0A5E4A9Z2_MARMO|nr:hypothetical protein GHT09_007651 [Marmota monax]VTJ53726.1 Hypothetical predicted protein [Marmota monax]
MDSSALQSGPETRPSDSQRVQFCNFNSHVLQTAQGPSGDEQVNSEASPATASSSPGTRCTREPSHKHGPSPDIKAHGRPPPEP